MHDPDSTHGFCGAALSTNVIHFWKSEAGKWEWEKIIDVENEPHPEWPIPVPGVMSAILVSMDDKYLYLNNWLHGDMRQYDISDPHNPKLTGQVWMGGLLGRAPEVNGVKVAGGPQMFQLSLDGQAALRHHVPVLDLGQPVLPGDPHPGRGDGDDRLRRRERRHEHQSGLHRRFRQGAQRAQPLPRDPLSRRRLHQRHLGVSHTRTITIANRGGASYAVDRRRPCSTRLREQGVDLPYGCKYGGCITCAARLTAGEVDQRRQTALNNRQITHGYVYALRRPAVSDCTLEIGVESHGKLYRNPFSTRWSPTS